MEPFWNEAANGQTTNAVKYEGEATVSNFPYCTESSLNFSTSTTAYSEDDAEYATARRNKSSRQDPLSHRIIEKRRRDRMNSCLADLSHLIPPQYQRKGRGRIEKTEIIEMAIRHLKHLQSECAQKDNEYRLGYTDCMKEAAKFLYGCELQETAYRMLNRLREHIEEVAKSDCLKLRSNHIPDNISGSSGSPQQLYGPQHPNLCEIPSHSDDYSTDQNDVKDLSFRSHLNQLQNHTQSNGTVLSNTTDTKLEKTENLADPNCFRSGHLPISADSSADILNLNLTKNRTINLQQQAPIITSTGASSLQHHTDTSNNDFESVHEPLLHTDSSNMHSPPPRDSLLNSSAITKNHFNSEGILSMRLRNLSESSHDIEHNNNYKYKNHIKERFNHELHDDETSSDQCTTACSKLPSEHSHSLSDHSKDGTEPEIVPILAKKRKLAASIENNCDMSFESKASLSSLKSSDVYDKKAFSFRDIKTELQNTNSSNLHRSDKPDIIDAMQQPERAVPIFALHAHGNYYIPLTIDATVLSQYVYDSDSFERNYTSVPAPVPVLHPININVRFMPSSIISTNAVAAAAANARKSLLRS